MKKLLVCFSILALASIGTSVATAGDDFDTVSITSGYQSKNGSFSGVPSGAQVLVEASGNEASASAYASADGGGVSGLTAYWTGPGGTTNQAYTTYADTISYQLWASGWSYSLIDIHW